MVNIVLVPLFRRSVPPSQRHHSKTPVAMTLKMVKHEIAYTRRTHHKIRKFARRIQLLRSVFIYTAV